MNICIYICLQTHRTLGVEPTKTQWLGFGIHVRGFRIRPVGKVWSTWTSLRVGTWKLYSFQAELGAPNRQLSALFFVALDPCSGEDNNFQRAGVVNNLWCTKPNHCPSRYLVPQHEIDGWWDFGGKLEDGNWVGDERVVNWSNRMIINDLECEAKWIFEVDPGKAYDNNNYKLIYSCAVVDGIFWPIGHRKYGLNASNCLNYSHLTWRHYKSYIL